MNSRKRHELVLAIYPNSRGFAFVLFEGPISPVDWGIVVVGGRNKNRRCLVRIRSIFVRYAPDILVIQDMSESGTHRAHRLRRLNRMIEDLADARQIPLYAYSRAQVRSCFTQLGFVTKQGIAEAIAKQISAFERYVPPVRKPWMSEHVRMGLFDAAALAWTFFSRAKG
jgi:hypothetical protein